MITPRATEKAYNAESQHTYIFFVPKSATKQEIAKAIAANFQVTVTDVRVAVRKGKSMRYSRGKHAFPGITHRQDKKVAYVTVKEGDKIPVFEEPAEQKADTKAKTAEDKADKKSEKKVEKSAKKAEKKEDK